MDEFSGLLDKLPIAIILHDKNKILHANKRFKNFFSEQEKIEDINLSQWFLQVIKDKEKHNLLIEAIEGKEEITLNTEGSAKGIIKYWSICSFPISENLVDSQAQLTILQDIASAHNKKSYWELHLRVSKATMQLIKENDLRQKLEQESAQLSSQLIMAARKAGMADIATSVLHNVGNVLNSVKITVSSLMESMQKSNVLKLKKMASIVETHLDDAAHFFSEDSQGKLFPKYLIVLVNALSNEHEFINKEMNGLTDNILHIEQIIAMQQMMSGKVDMSEKISLSETLDSAIQLCGKAFVDNNIDIKKQYNDNLFIVTDKFKILQIFVNLLQNAKDALLPTEFEIPDKKILIKIQKHDAEQLVDIQISDNGVGIQTENLTKVFTLGFTTKVKGHGFGLHGSAVAAKELNGTLQATSDGAGQGATFSLTLPIAKELNHSLERSAHD